ncbi:MAG: hypothetical protein G01um101425_685 [Candidatus Peregrinibacteria bacterium Gr01-1014_25]|nr:MAG: hypothetical protein G01um101425_685 [Candidatus Peregrinibacteria bacterium Gr01-1014_25]
MVDAASLLEQFVFTISSNPVVFWLQASIAFAGAAAVYLLFYTVRDILLRTRSLPYQLGCIALVAAVPVAGFFLYLLVRPARTVKERQLEKLLKDVLAGERKIMHTRQEQGKDLDVAARRIAAVLAKKNAKSMKTREAVPA